MSKAEIRKKADPVGGPRSAKNKYHFRRRVYHLKGVMARLNLQFCQIDHHLRMPHLSRREQETAQHLHESLLKQIRRITT